MVVVSNTAIMDNNYEPSFEVVDKAEDAEDYLLAKNRRTTEPTQQAAQKIAVDSTINNIATNSDTATTDGDKMNFNGMNFLSAASESKDVENGNVAPEDCDVLKCVTEDEEGQEALWLEEAETTPSTASANASPAVNKSSTRRSSFLFLSGGGGGVSKQQPSHQRELFHFERKGIHQKSC
jgi:hypothetical protein